MASRVAQFFAASGEDEAARGEQAGARPSDAPGEAATAEEFESSVARAASATAMFVEHDASGAAAPAAALHAAVAVTRAPLFRDKAALFPGSWMVVGADTAARLVMDKYYGGSRDAMLAALLSIRGQGCGCVTGASLRLRGTQHAAQRVHTSTHASPFAAPRRGQLPRGRSLRHARRLLRDAARPRHSRGAAGHVR